MEEKVSKEAVDLAERYAEALDNISAFNEYIHDMEDDIKLAKKFVEILDEVDAYHKSGVYADEETIDEADAYLKVLNAIDEVGKKVAWSDDDVKKAQDYLTVLNEIEEKEKDDIND